MPAAIELTTVRPSDLDEEIIARHLGERINTEGWTVDQFVKLSMGARWCAVCECHDKPVASCPNNLSIASAGRKAWGAEDWQKWYATRSKVVEKPAEKPVEQPNEQPVVAASVPVAKKIVETSAPIHEKRTRRTRSTVDLPPERYAEVLAYFDTGVGVVATAKKFNLQPPWVSAWLRENNRPVSRGRRAKDKALIPA